MDPIKRLRTANSTLSEIQESFECNGTPVATHCIISAAIAGMDRVSTAFKKPMRAVGSHVGGRALSKIFITNPRLI